MLKKIGNLYKNFDKSLLEFKIWIVAQIDPICRVIDKSSGSILDVACGDGFQMRLIRSIWSPKYAVGVDLFKKYIVNAKRLKLHDRYAFSDVRKLKFPTKSFDIVLASQIIEHLPKKDGRKFIKDLEKIAKRQVIIATPNGPMYHPAVDNNNLQLHLSHYYPEEFEKLGYKIVKYGRKSILGENGIVHRIKSDPVRKMFFLLDVFLSPLYYLFPIFADYYFVAYKDVSKN